MAINLSRTQYLGITLFGLSFTGFGVAVWLFGISGHVNRTMAAKTKSDSVESQDKAISVQAVRPRRDKQFRMTVERPADVEAYYRANIEAQVAGEVKWIQVAPGSQVKKDQVLVQLHVPDKWALLSEKKNVVAQRQRESELAAEKKHASEVAVNTALANVELKKSLLKEAQALTHYREIQLENLERLLKSNSVERIARDEGQKNLEYARATEGGAESARIKAEQEVEDARANVRVAAADMRRCEQLIEVAKSDQEQAAAITGYAEVKAPFPGAVVSRHVDPGSFVQNASTGSPTPVLTMERSDIVTVVMRVPDNYAPYITSSTEAVLELDSLPGLKIHGKVTRFAPSLVTSAHDRTMRVEVDLWNESPEQYQKFIADKKNLADLKEGQLPIIPEFTGKEYSSSKHLIPGMYGNMRLILKEFGQIELIPSKAIQRHGGRSSIYVVRDGKVHEMPVDVQVDDGILAHVVALGDKGKILGELADSEQVIVSNLEELSEGQVVTAARSEDRANGKPLHAAP
jgi:multidrug efflux pump subunit AcrA (membrane-fusion protein)